MIDFNREQVLATIVAALLKDGIDPQDESLVDLADTITDSIVARRRLACESCSGSGTSWTHGETISDGVRRRTLEECPDCNGTGIQP